MADVVINHCTLRVRRRSGWSWGPEPRALLEAAMRSLPDLLAQHLASFWPDDAHLEISTPLKIRLPLAGPQFLDQQLAALANKSFASNSHYVELGRRIEAAIKTTLTTVQVFPSDNLSSDPDHVTEPGVVFEQVSDPEWVGSPLPLLLRWQEQGLLETRLSCFSREAVEAWHTYLFRDVHSVRPPATKARAEKITELVRAFVQQLPEIALDRTAILRRRLILAVRIAATFKVSTIDKIVREAIASVLPLRLSTADPTVVQELQLPDELASTTQDSSQIHETVEIAPSILPRIPTLSIPSQVVEGELRISSALPFLLLGPLSRVGYLETLAATLEAAGLAKQSSLFALALAHKVLKPPDRGWRRDQASMIAAATFAGHDAAATEAAVVEFARNIATHLSPLEAILSGSLAEGHRLGEPLLLHQTLGPAGLLLLDVDGSFPVMWSLDLERLLPILRSFGTSVCLIPQTSAEPELLARLDAEGCRFITDGPPARGERWRDLRSGNQRWWTNERHSSQSELLRSARSLSPARENAEELWSQFDLQRPSVPLATDSTLDKHLTLAASVALGTIAWTLWREQETTTPQLALSRFGNLDARVRFERGMVRVFLPLGRRYRDLLEHRLLEDIPCVPWLAGRRVQFAGG